MPHATEDLIRDYPEHASAISALRCSDGYFARVADRYHEARLRLARAEAGSEPLAQADMEKLERQSGLLRQQLVAMARVLHPTS